MEAAPANASIALVATHGIEALRATLHGIRETVDRPYELVVLADQHFEDAVAYLTRHYLRGDVAAIGLESAGDEIHHCGLDHAFHLTSGEVLVRIEDDLQFCAGWLGATLDTLDEHPEIGVLGLVQVPEPKRRGRPPKRRREPEAVDAIDTRAFATRRALFAEAESWSKAYKCLSGCGFQGRVRALGHLTAYLPGQVRLAATAPGGHVGAAHLPADLPVHDGPGGSMSLLRQVYQLGDEVLLPCMTCGDNEFEVLAGEIDFCEHHEVPVGFTYTLRCATCHDVQHEEDIQFRCPE